MNEYRTQIISRTKNWKRKLRGACTFVRIVCINQNERSVNTCLCVFISSVNLPVGRTGTTYTRPPHTFECPRQLWKFSHVQLFVRVRPESTTSTLTGLILRACEWISYCHVDAPYNIDWPIFRQTAFLFWCGSMKHDLIETSILMNFPTFFLYLSPTITSCDGTLQKVRALSKNMVQSFLCEFIGCSCMEGKSTMGPEHRLSFHDVIPDLHSNTMNSHRLASSPSVLFAKYRLTRCWG